MTMPAQGISQLLSQRDSRSAADINARALELLVPTRLPRSCPELTTKIRKPLDPGRNKSTFNTKR
jgi:hypothetical protein